MPKWLFTDRTRHGTINRFQNVIMGHGPGNPPLRSSSLGLQWKQRQSHEDFKLYILNLSCIYGFRESCLTLYSNLTCKYNSQCTPFRRGKEQDTRWCMWSRCPCTLLDRDRNENLQEGPLTRNTEPNDGMDWTSRHLSLIWKQNASMIIFIFYDIMWTFLLIQAIYDIRLGCAKEKYLTHFVNKEYLEWPELFRPQFIFSFR